MTVEQAIVGLSLIALGHALDGIGRFAAAVFAPQLDWLYRTVDRAAARLGGGPPPLAPREVGTPPRSHVRRLDGDTTPRSLP